MKNLLSIDDEPGVVECIRESLRLRGYEIFTATDPDVGLRLFAENDIALVLLDVNMPKKNGFEVYHEMRQIRKVPVLFVTAYPRAFNPQSDEVMRMWQEEFVEGTTDIIYKPFRLQALFDKVEALIGAPDEAEEEEGAD